jgi:hypothetical protein
LQNKNRRQKGVYGKAGVKHGAFKVPEKIVRPLYRNADGAVPAGAIMIRMNSGKGF